MLKEIGTTNHVHIDGTKITANATTNTAGR